METELVSGKAVPKSDLVLSLLLDLPGAAPLSDKSILRFGIENASHDIYRIVGIGDPFAFADLLDLLPQFGYDVELLEAVAHDGLRAVIRKQYDEE